MFRDYMHIVCGVLIVLFGTTAAFSQGNRGAKPDKHTPVLWESVDITGRDLYAGPIGNTRPDLTRISLVRDEKGGHSLKYRIKDASGRIWIAKTGDEAQPETVAVRLLWAIGFKTETDLLVPSLTIPGRGTLTNIRLEARDKAVKRVKRWKWGRTPFEGTREMHGLILMMALINNWDLKGTNNVILRRGKSDEYVISDLGASFGSTGTNPLPIFWRIGRSRNAPDDYDSSPFIFGVRNDRLKLGYYGKHRELMFSITPADARWLADLLLKLSDKQISDAFRSANYGESEIDKLSRALIRRIGELADAAEAATK